MTIVRYFIGIYVSIMMLNGCGGGPGVTTTTASYDARTGLPATPRATKNNDFYIESIFGGNWNESEGVRPSENWPILLREHFTTDQMSRIEAAYTELKKVYGVKKQKQDLPYLNMMIIGRYLKDHPAANKRLDRMFNGGVVFFDEVDSVDEILKSIWQVREELQSPGAPNVLVNNPFLQRSSQMGWGLHYYVMSNMQNGFPGLDQDFQDSAPMVVDASGNRLLTGLEDNQWYFYSQGSAFRGHLEPVEGLRQDYRGEGVELGLFSTRGNGFLLGGMLGVQKVRMTFSEGGSDGDIYRLGPFLSWSDDHWSLDAMLTYGWVGLKTRQYEWTGNPTGNEWAAHAQLSYSIFLDEVIQGMRLVPEGYVGYRVGDISAHEETSSSSSRHLGASRQKGLTTRIGSGLVYTLPDLSAPTELSAKVGLQKTHERQHDQSIDNGRYQWPNTPLTETTETAVYYGLGFHRLFGAGNDKLIGLDYIGLTGQKSGSDSMTLSYRQKF